MLLFCLLYAGVQVWMTYCCSYQVLGVFHAVSRLEYGMERWNGKWNGIVNVHNEYGSNYSHMTFSIWDPECTVPGLAHAAPNSICDVTKCNVGIARAELL